MEFCGSAGTLIAAALESGGYYFQSYLLDVLEAPLTGPVAVLIYVAVAIATIFNFALTGQAKNAVWMLIGPVVFFAIIGTRDVVSPAVWKFGDNLRTQEAVNNQIQGYIPNYSSSVASLFSYYNRIISNIVNQVVAIVSGSSSDLDARFVLRSELYGGIRGQTVADPGVKELIQGALFSDCSDMFRLGGKIMDERTRPQQRSEIEVEYQQARKLRISISKWPKARDYLTSLSNNFPGLFQTALSGDAESVMTNIKQISAFNIVSGEQVVASVNDASATNGGVSESFVDNYSCNQIWNFVLIGLHTQAGKVVDKAQRTGIAAGIDAESLRKDLAGLGQKASFGNPINNQVADEYLLRRVASSYLLRNEIRTPNAAAFITEYASKGFVIPGVKLESESDMTSLERSRLRALESGEKWGLMTTASQLPYFQGMLLYILSAFFPFFALLLIIPGKYSGFINWFFLWMWVKSWDIGYAVVMRLDDLLYSLFVSPPSLGLDYELASTLDSLRAIDPTFQLTTYYGIIGTCLASVPVVTAQLLLKSFQGIANTVTDAVSEFSEYVYARQAGMGRDPALMYQSRQVALSTYNAMHEFTEEFANGSVYQGSANVDLARLARNSRNNMANTDSLVRERVLSSAFINAIGGGNAYPELGQISSALFGSLPKDNKDVAGILANINNYRGALSGVLGAMEKQRASYLTSLRGQSVDIEAAARQFDAVALNYMNIRADFEKGVVEGAFSAEQSADTHHKHQLGMEFVRSIQRHNFTSLSYGLIGATIPQYSDRDYDLNQISTIIGHIQSLGDIVEDVAPEIAYPFHYPTGGAPSSTFWRSNLVVTSDFGVSRTASDGRPYSHAGTDIVSTNGDGSVGAIDDGIVIFAGTINGYGQTVIIQHADGKKSLYAHMKDHSLSVSEGDHINRDQKLGDIGSTGHSTGPHVHFEMIAGDRQIGYRSINVGLGNNSGGSVAAIPLKADTGMTDLLVKKESRYTGQNQERAGSPILARRSDDPNSSTQ